MSLCRFLLLSDQKPFLAPGVPSVQLQAQYPGDSEHEQGSSFLRWANNEWFPIWIFAKKEQVCDHICVSRQLRPRRG